MEDQRLPQQKHYCNVTFLSVGDKGPDGLPIERLLRCSRCQETFYCGKDQQKRHWKVHKKVCRADGMDIEEDTLMEFRTSENIFEVASGIAHIHFNTNWTVTATYPLILEYMLGRPLRILFERLQILSNRRSSSGVETTAAECNQLEILFVCLMNLTCTNNRTIELIWAIPGMTTFLLNTELMSDAMRQRKIQRAAPTEKELKFQGYDPSFQNSCLCFADAIGFLLMASIFTVDASDATPHGKAFRKTPLAAIAARKMMRWYVDPYTRVSFPTRPLLAEEPSEQEIVRRGLRDFHFVRTLHYLMEHLPDDSFDSTAIIPGLAIHDVIHLVASEPEWKTSFFNYYADYFFDLIIFAPRKPMAWKAFSLEARAVSAHEIVGLFRAVPDLITYMGSEPLFAVTGFDRVADFDRVTGTTKQGEVSWLKVIKLAMMKKSPTGVDFPFGPHTDFFAQWYTRTADDATSLFNVLIDLLREQRNGFSQDLMPPTAVLSHIIEYTMEPFSNELTFHQS